jgi:hypothetical protein
VTVAVVDALDIACGLESRLAAISSDDGVALVPVARAAGLIEFRDDGAAVAVEHALLGERAVGPVGVGERAPGLLARVVDGHVVARRGRGAGTRLVRPSPAVAVAGGNAWLVRIEAVSPMRVVRRRLVFAGGAVQLAQGIHFGNRAGHEKLQSGSSRRRAEASAARRIQLW